MLDSRGGSDLYQVSPHQVSVRAGSETLAAIRLTAKGPLRWYAACCGTPMATTWTGPKLPFATLTVSRFDHPDDLGPIQAQAFRRQALGYVEKEGAGMPLVYLGFARRLAAAFLTGKWRETPFFDREGNARAAVASLTDSERQAAYDAERTV